MKFHLKKQLNSWLNDYTDNDIIELVNADSTDWLSSFVVAPIEVHVCEIIPSCQYRRIRHSIPKADEILDNMIGAVKFSKVHVDLKAGYHQIPLKNIRGK